MRTYTCNYCGRPCEVSIDDDGTPYVVPIDLTTAERKVSELLNFKIQLFNELAAMTIVLDDLVDDYVEGRGCTKNAKRLLNYIKIIKVQTEHLCGKV